MNDPDTCCRITAGSGVICESAFNRKIATYLSGDDDADTIEPDDTPGAGANTLAGLEQRRAELNRLARRLDEEGRTSVVDGEDNARPMGSGRGRKPTAYNVQTTADADTGFTTSRVV